MDPERYDKFEIFFILTWNIVQSSTEVPFVIIGFTLLASVFYQAVLTRSGRLPINIGSIANAPLSEEAADSLLTENTTTYSSIESAEMSTSEGHSGKKLRGIKKVLIEKPVKCLRNV